MPYCYNCNLHDEYMETVCSDCSITLCSTCENNDEVLCKCYGKCDSCECDVNRGEDGWRCMDCQEWLCYSCKHSSECRRCRLGKSSDDDDAEEEEAEAEEEAGEFQIDTDQVETIN